MKNYILFLFILAAAQSVSAQSNKVINAYMQLQEKEYKIARELIDDASIHPKTADEAKTWYYRGKIYMAIYHDIGQGNKDYNISKETALFSASESYKKARGLETSRIDSRQLNSEYHMIANYMLNEGVLQYNDKNYADAVTLFKGTVSIQEDFQVVDSLAIFNVGLASEQLENYDEAISYYLKCARIGYRAEDCYHFAAVLSREQGKVARAKEIIEEGLKNYPQSLELLVAKINTLLTEEDSDGALFTIDQALVVNPENADLLFTRGAILESSDVDAAIASYKKAIDIDPEHVNSLYNLGAAYYNMAVDLRNAEGSDMSTGVAELKESKKYLEKVVELAPGIQAARDSLVIIEEILTAQ